MVARTIKQDVRLTLSVKMADETRRLHGIVACFAGFLAYGGARVGTLGGLVVTAAFGYMTCVHAIAWLRYRRSIRRGLAEVERALINLAKAAHPSAR